MNLDSRLRLRVLLLVLVGAVVWILGTRERDARAEAAALRRQAADRARAAAVGGEAEMHREVLAQVLDRLAERPPGPRSAAEVRERLMTVAASLGVEVPVAHFQPLQRPPAGARGTEVKLTVAGAGEALIRFLERLESAGLPIRFDRTDITLRAAGAATLAVAAAVLWPDVAAPPDPDRLAADARMGALAAWLASASSPSPSLPVSEHPAVGEPDDIPVRFAVPAAEPPAPAEPRPVLRGFFDPGKDARVRAMFSLAGEVTMVGAGDRVGEYTVLELDPPAGAVLVRPGFPPLRLTLR